VSEHGDLLIGEGTFHAIFVVPESIIFLLLVVIDFGSVEVICLLDTQLVFRCQEVG